MKNQQNDLKPPPTVDGSEILRAPVTIKVVLKFTNIYDGFFEHPRWLFGISEPSTVVNHI